MQQFYKKYSSFFLLIIFLVPQIEKQLHDLKHANDVHCSIHAEFHFHKQEHSCGICDYTIGLLNPSAVENHELILSSINFIYLSYTTQVTLFELTCKLPPRAPPVA